MRRVILIPDVDAGESMRDLLVDVQDVTGDRAGVAFGGVVVSPEVAHTYLTHAVGGSASSDSASDADPPPPAPTKRAAKKAAPATKTTAAGRSRTARTTGE